MATKEENNLKELIEQETARKFNSNNKMRCPFHNDKTASLSIKKDNSYWKCFGCGRGGDVIDFIKEYKHMNYIEACKYLNIDLPKEEKEKYINFEKVEKIAKSYKGLKFIKLYSFVNENNKVIYYEAKYYDSVDNKNVSRPFTIDGMCKQEVNKIPYNYYKLLQSIKKNKHIFIVEGPKDADTLIHFGYLATSFKGVKDFNYSIFQDSIVYIIPDTGEAGEKYKDDLFYKLKDYVKEFNVIYPKGLKELGNNKDITDWFQSGKTLEDFKVALNDKWDYIKNKNFKYVKSNGQPLIIWENFQRLCEINNIVIKYNELFKTAEFNGTLFELSDCNSCYEDLYSLCIKSLFGLKRTDLSKFIYRLSQANSYNPVRDYLHNCYKNWNHKEGYIKQLADTIITPDDYNDSFKLTLLKRWLIGTANIAFNDGTQNTNGVLVIQGRQGIYKTRWIKTIVPNITWVASNKLIDAKNKDLIMDVTSSWITELGELKASVKSEKLDELKMFLTRETDRYRKPYAAEMQEYPRLTSFYATVNNEEFLVDQTGNRRFWVIRAIELILDHNIDLNQLWGEVMHLLRDNKEPHWLNKNEEKQLHYINSRFEVKTEADSKMNDLLDWSLPKDKWVYTTFTELCNYLGIKSNSNTRMSLINLGAIAPKEPFRVKGHTGVKRWWLVPPLSGVKSLEYTKSVQDIKEPASAISKIKE